jgi:5-methylcytosine-specific restriction endonuclease McrA
LFEFAKNELGYSEPEANSRITAARLTQQMPELSRKIEMGSLSLTQLVKASAFFGQEKKCDKPLSREEKLEVFECLENKSVRESERLLLSMSSNPTALQEKTRVISETHTEIRLVADEELMKDLNRLKEIWAHALPKATWHEVIHRAVKIAIEKEDKLKKAERALARIEGKQRRPSQSSQGQSASTKADAGPSPSLDRGLIYSTDLIEASSCRTISRSREVRVDGYPTFSVSHPVASRWIASATRHLVWARDAGQCTYISPDGTRCESRYGLEMDHVRPYAMGGDNSPGNLRLRCKNHNCLHAIESYGREKISRHLQPR